MNVVHTTARAVPTLVKISKVGAGYVYRSGRSYRCSECINFISDKGRCMILGKDDGVSPDGYCTMWSEGKRPGADDDDWDDQPQGSYKPSEVGYGEKKDGTLCKKCVHFDKGYCEIVEGKIGEDACCNNHKP